MNDSIHNPAVLLRAAKAANIQGRWDARRRCLVRHGEHGEAPGWQPLEDGSAASQLQARLGLRVSLCKRVQRVRVEEPALLEPRFVEVDYDDATLGAATRKAIVLMAARLADPES
ncbi:hypothetical protein [Billgrantia kenyensis]|uniref:Uncharacterized protein n=1 Tax=Billgrantia kenyensis TaxID=321266 RepID=A0A7V9VYP1_9GAMM|nr:hypothetical protein [Halomonas kenyensis]MBA2777832.1 hypothetical protein [Halomonas kenyensis]MCG6661303.1 hypothetical protein [Halomonas kenyensis]